MANAARRPCRHPGCGQLVSDGSGYCTRHAAPGSFADKQRGSRHERGYGTKWDKIRKRIIERDHGLCQECLRNGRVTLVGSVPFSAHVDHIVSKVDGGGDEDANLQTLCRQCHQAKTNAEKNRGRGASNV